MNGGPPVDWLNYHHLLYFWTVAREGGLTPAAAKLHLSQPTLSSQIQKLERALGLKLWRRVGRGIQLTDDGQVVYRYANDIFSLGHELLDTLRGRPVDQPLPFTVGIPDILPKLVVHQLLRPCLELAEQLNLVCYEGKLPGLLEDLAAHRLDLVLSDSPAGPAQSVRVYNHLLGTCGTTIFGVARWARRYRRNFPQSLAGAPHLLPTSNTAFRRSIDQWLDSMQLRLEIVGEFEDSALLKTFGQAGRGLFFGPSAIEAEICRQYKVTVVGRIPELRENYYAISVERRLKHPAVVAISAAARNQLFAK
ncbi:MAG: transcriptional activator NhaR [Pirellulales bacterium]|nr:transcriptional activator NhaR [Pirellulales bacterium]